MRLRQEIIYLEVLLIVWKPSSCFSIRFFDFFMVFRIFAYGFSAFGDHGLHCSGELMRTTTTARMSKTRATKGEEETKIKCSEWLPMGYDG